MSLWLCTVHGLVGPSPCCIRAEFVNRIGDSIMATTDNPDWKDATAGSSYVDQDREVKLMHCWHYDTEYHRNTAMTSLDSASQQHICCYCGVHRTVSQKQPLGHGKYAPAEHWEVLPDEPCPERNKRVEHWISIEMQKHQCVARCSCGIWTETVPNDMEIEDTMGYLANKYKTHYMVETDNNINYRGGPRMPAP